MKSDLTVVVPVFNVEKYLDKCISSVLNQTYKNLDILIVDDGSKDSSGRIADEIAGQHNNITVIHQENKGLAGARNTGILNSNTKYIAFVDSDDYIDAQMYSILLEGMRETNSEIGICGVLSEKEDGTRRNIYKKVERRIFSKEEALIELNSLNYFNMSFCNACFNRDLFFTDAFGEKEVLFPEGKLSEDFYIMHKIMGRANRIYYDSTPCYHYLIRYGSITKGTKVNVAPIFASKERIAFYNKWFPQLAYSAISQYVITLLGTRVAYLSKKIAIPDEIRNTIEKDSKRYLPTALTNNSLSVKRKMLIFISYAFPHLYVFAYDRFKMK